MVQKYYINMHAIKQYLNIATPERKKYFVFSCIRNPLDEAVSVYFRYKTNHQERYTNPAKWRKNGGSVSNYSLKRFQFIKDKKADFPSFLKQFYNKPYDNWSSLDHKKFNFIIRFENLSNDFSTVLDLLGIHQIRSLPMVNKTSERDPQFQIYYPPETYEHTRKVFGPFMREWNYDFPKEWGEEPVPLLSIIEFYLLKKIRVVSGKYFGD